MRHVNGNDGPLLASPDIQIPDNLAARESLDFFRDGFAVVEDFAADDGVEDHHEEATAFDREGWE